MRLPLQHAPPAELPLRMRCIYLEHLVGAARGLPLAPAAALVASPRSRGRHGNALQWHLGLDSHDASAAPDWEGRIEIKLVTVWRVGGVLACDRLKVCDVSIDPWRKLANVMFVCADRLTRTVVGHCQLHLAGPPREQLVRAWQVDPHFGTPDLLVESRQQGDVMSPAYYVSSAWLLAHVIPTDLQGVFEAPRRVVHGGEPMLTIVDAVVDASGPANPTPCPRCGAPLRYDAERVAARGCAPVHHGLPLAPGCATRQHIAVAAQWLPTPARGDRATQRAGLQGTLPPEHVGRLAEAIPEPDDHGHE